MTVPAHAEIRRKIIGVPLEKSLQKQEDGSVLVKGKFTSDSRDEVGDIITRSATERAIPKYRQWGNIRYMHQPKPVGRVTRIGVEDGLAWNEVEIRVIDPSTVFEVEQGLLQALSVGILVNFQEVDMLEDGGWIINDYQLAEISLVDHPANYDAKLQLGLDAALRDKAREIGLIPALRSVGMAVEGEIAMDKTDEKGISDEATPAVTEEAPAATPEETSEVTDATPVETDKAAAPATEEQPAAEGAGEEAPVEGTPAFDPTAIFNAFNAAVEKMTSVVEAFQASLQEASEQQKAQLAEVQKATEQPDKSDAGEVELEGVKKQLAELTARFEELTTPANRKGAMPTEEPPKEPVAPVETAEKDKAVEPESTDLRSAVKRFVTTSIK